MTRNGGITQEARCSMTTEAGSEERFFKIEKFYRPLLYEAGQEVGAAQTTAPELIIERLRELVPLLAFTKAMVVLEEQPHGR
jgi:hypothetical protein